MSHVFPGSSEILRTGDALNRQYAVTDCGLLTLKSFRKLVLLRGDFFFLILIGDSFLRIKNILGLPALTFMAECFETLVETEGHWNCTFFVTSSLPFV